jgi:hypothetical protein
MPRLWRRMPRCAPSGGATRARALKPMDRKREGKRTANEAWASPTGPDGKITRLKDGRTRLGYKPEHAVDLDTGAIVAAEIHPADGGDTATLPGTLRAAARGLEAAGAAPSAGRPAERVADKGDHSRAVVTELDGSRGRTRIAEPKARGGGVSRWRGDREAQRAVDNNRARLRSGLGKQALRLRAEKVERSFAHTQRWRRPAPDRAAGTGERAPALPDPRRRLQSWPGDAAPARRRHAPGLAAGAASSFGSSNPSADLPLSSFCSRPSHRRPAP